MSVTASGFRTYAEGVTVSVNTVTRMDARMQVGQVNEQVTVEATAAVLQTEKADTHSEISSRAVTQIPLPGFCNYQSLINLVPGATPARFQKFDSRHAGAFAYHERKRHQPQQQHDAN